MNKDKLIALLNTINKLEIKGQENILLMYSIISFIQNELSDIQEEENKNKGG